MTEGKRKKKKFHWINKSFQTRKYELKLGFSTGVHSALSNIRVTVLNAIKCYVFVSIQMLTFFSKQSLGERG